MGNPKQSWLVLGTMLFVDAIVGVALAVLVDPLIGALAFVVSATISLLSSRSIRMGSPRAGGRGPAAAPESPPPSADAEEAAPAEAADPTADPDYNPYARED